MSRANIVGFNREQLPETFLALEKEKSSLILQANLLQHEQRYEMAADKFAAAATIEENLGDQLLVMNKYPKAVIHQWSALSCWVQAGDVHRALRLGHQLLQSSQLSEAQSKQVSRYLETLRRRRAEWISQWRPEPMVMSG